MDVDARKPLTLGRKFLTTSQALIDISEARIILIVGDEEVVFRFTKAIEH